MIVIVGIVELAGTVLYRRRFYTERDGWRWFWKRTALLMAEPRFGEVVSLVDVNGENKARIACTEVAGGSMRVVGTGAGGAGDGEDAPRS